MAKRRTKKTQPTERSLGWMRDLGYTVDKVEHWIGNPFVPMGRKRRDLFNFIDIVGMIGSRQGILGVQATVRNSMNARVDKCLTECRDQVRLWLKTGNQFLVAGWYVKKIWSPRKKAGSVRKFVVRWRVRLIEIKLGKNNRLLVHDVSEGGW